MKQMLTRLEEGPGLDSLKPVLDMLPPLNIISGPCIAGGAARRVYQGLPLQDADIDVFFFSYSQLAEAKKFLLERGANLKHESKAAWSFTVPVQDIEYKIQLIRRRTYGNSEDLIKDFDFTVCQIVTDGEHFIHAKETFPDIDEKKLRLAPEGRVAPVNIARRAVKYLNYGFTPVDGVMEKVISEGLKAVSYSDVEGSTAYDEKTQPVADWIQNAATY